jgi:hypothetical protein
MERTTITAAKLPNSNRVAALAAVELEAGAAVDDAEEADEAVMLAAELVDAKAMEEVLVTRLEEDPTSGVLAGAETEEDEEVPTADDDEEVPTGEEPGEIGVLTGTAVEEGATEATEEDEAVAAQVESAVSLTLTHWVTESLSVV